MRTSIVTTCLLGICLVATACTEDDEIYPGIAHCTYEEQELSWDEPTPDGTLPEDYLAFSEGDYQVTGGTMHHDGELDFHIGFARRGDHGIYYTDPDGLCDPYLGIPATFSISLDGGELDESFDVIATATHTGDLEIFHAFSPDDIQGTWSPEAPEGETIGGLTLRTFFYFDETPLHGDLNKLIEGHDDEMAWQNSQRVYFW